MFAEVLTLAGVAFGGVCAGALHYKWSTTPPRKQRETAERIRETFETWVREKHERFDIVLTQRFDRDRGNLRRWTCCVWDARTSREFEARAFSPAVAYQSVIIQMVDADVDMARIPPIA